jgi:transcriptional regulator with XRE-family HTH domain
MLCTLGWKIRTLRERKGWTQKQLAEAAGLNVRDLSRLERGILHTKGPRDEPGGRLERLASALEIPVDELRQALVSGRGRGRDTGQADIKKA